jgi:hypothetical protein
MELFVRTGEMTQDDEWDILLAEQYNDLRRRHHELRAELRLMFAVLEDAIHCYFRHMNAKGRERRKLFYDVRHWMNSRHGKELFAFETLCEALGIDAGRLRAMLEQQRREITNVRRPTSRQRMWVARPRPR